MSALEIICALFRKIGVNHCDVNAIIKLLCISIYVLIFLDNVNLLSNGELEQYLMIDNGG